MGRRKPATTHGVTVVDKPAGMTSHDVVALLRRRFGERRVGHAGTLDPDATGVLVVGLGTATRLLRFVTDSRKRYQGEVVLGTETSTLDAAGEITAVHDMAGVGVDDARRVVAEHLTGDILQVPPMVSALKVGGRRLHELAREGIEVERVPRPVTVFGFDVSEGSAPGVLRIDVECSSGTYIRSLAAELGRLLGGGAHLRDLRRTRGGVVHARRGGAARRLRVCCRSRPPCDRSRRSRSATTSPRWWPTDGCSRRGRGTDRGRCSTTTRPCSRSTSRTASTRPNPLSCSPHRLPGSVAVVRIVTDLTEAVWPGERSVITIGAYDGVHLGHQAVIRHVRQVAGGPCGTLGRAHVRPPPGHDRAAGVGAAAADRSRAASRAARADRHRCNRRVDVRPTTVGGAAERVRGAGVRQRAGDDGGGGR